MKRPNLRIIRIEEGEELQLKGTGNISDKIKEENFSNLKGWERYKEGMKVQETHKIPNRLDQNAEHGQQ